MLHVVSTYLPSEHMAVVFFLFNRALVSQIISKLFFLKRIFPFQDPLFIII